MEIRRYTALGFGGNKNPRSFEKGCDGRIVRGGQLTKQADSILTFLKRIGRKVSSYGIRMLLPITAHNFLKGEGCYDNVWVAYMHTYIHTHALACGRPLMHH